MEAIINKGSTLPGILDEGIEIFWDAEKDTLRAIYAGEIWPFNKLPKNILQTLESFMELDEEAMRIMDVAGVWRTEDRLWTYFKCGYGQINQEADVSLDEGLSQPEYWSCACNGHCCLKSYFKKNRGGAQGIELTTRQLEVLKAISEFLPDKAVADQLGISIDTLNKHKGQLLAKTGFQTKMELVVWAHQNSLL